MSYSPSSLDPDDEEEHPYRPFGRGTDIQHYDDPYDPQQQPQQDDDGPPPPLCSVLTTVVDYIMTDPTPLEPREFRQTQQEHEDEAAATMIDHNDNPMQHLFLDMGRGISSNSSNNNNMDSRQQPKKTNSSIQVPVIRVFGPILRRDLVNDDDDTTMIDSPKQSACLYIHGAFPYMLARPVIAGPDGGPGRFSLNWQERLQHTDWDSVEAVTAILFVLQHALEATLHTNLSGGTSSSSNNIKTTSTRSHSRFIRQITVVVGRGFYTYCPGPAAPFLRVEYYNPTDRWRIKLALENGLAELPYKFYPHPKQYSYDNATTENGGYHDNDDDVSLDDNTPPEALAFHCYEAHIPYSMQFFKDYNLAGMSYIHLEQALFRRELPLRPSIHRCYPSVQKSGNGIGMQQDVDSDKQQDVDSDKQHATNQLFLRSNTESVWPSPESVTLPSPPHGMRDEDAAMADVAAYDNDNMALENLPDLHQATPPDDEATPSSSQQQQQQQRPLFPSLPTEASSDPMETTKLDLANTDLPGGVWSKSQTSCQVELDTTVAHILNVHDVLTEKQNKNGEDNQQHVCWRAVPSLETIWNQERRRMKRLLPPREDFLSQIDLQQPATPPLTLNVTDGAGHSGARLAKEGMERLVRVTDGLYEAHRRAARDIVERHAAQIERIDADVLQARNRPLGQNDHALDPAVEPVMHGMTPTDDEALWALEKLADGNEEKEMAGNSQSSLTLSHKQVPPSSDDDRERMDDMPPSQLKALLSISALQKPSSHASDSSSRPSSQIRLSNEQHEVALSQSTSGIYLTQKMGPHHGTSGIDWESQQMLTQRIDRGDGILDGPHQHIDEYINPETLRPYEDFDDDETLSDEELHDVGDNHVPHPQSSGMYFEQKEVASDEDADHLDNWLCESVEHGSILGAGGPHSVEVVHSDSEDQVPPFDAISNPNEAVHPDTASTQALELSCNKDVRGLNLQIKPPTRGNLLHACGARLLPMERKQDQPSWLNFSASYFKIYPTKQRSCLPYNPSQSGYYISRTSPPPTWMTVASWAKRAASINSLCLNEVHKRPRLGGPNGTIDARDGCLGVEDVEWDTEQRELLSQPAAAACDQARGMEKTTEPSINVSVSLTKSTPDDSLASDTQRSQGALKGIGAQGGRLHIEGGGELKAKTRASQSSDCSATKELPTPVSLMTVEIHSQCRKGKDASGRPLALTLQPDRDKVSAIVYVLGLDPGGGEPLRVVERGCLLVPPSAELEAFESCAEKDYLSVLKANIRASMPNETMGKTSPMSVECFPSERQLILRFASLVRWKDPDLLCSWDTQGAGLGFLVERGSMMSAATQGKHAEIDLAKLLGRTPTVAAISETVEPENAFQISIDDGLVNGRSIEEKKERWKGSGMGADWDERVGAGVAASSIVGRLVFASWKLVAEEVKHPNASYLQAVVSTVTGKRIPFHDNLKLTSWYSENRGKERWRVLHYRLTQAMSTIILFDAMDVIGRAGEAARLSGVELSQSFPGIRGSQYKVEGVLLRALQSLDSEERGLKNGDKPCSGGASINLSGGSVSQTQSPWKGRRGLASAQVPGEHGGVETPTERLMSRRYYFYSPSLRAADRQESLQVQALTLEPKSGHYEDPVIVCDFTALYPSLVIAYNLCYSTIGGHLEYQSTRDEMRKKGQTTGKIGPFSYPEGRSATILKHHFKSFYTDKADRAYIAPTGDIYVSETVVKGVLPQVLDEMLTTRAMLKKAAKLYKRNVKDLPSAVLRQLEARQLALKYVANVTYGYTSATFSGRCAMPLLADTIVECGRRTLTDAINLANGWGKDSNGRWSGCTVIYGDTDSVFVRLPGRSVHEAFQFGEEFCKAVTKNNPPPVQLKLEKVYMGSIMQTKKKYCGMKFESVDQKKPEFEAKGIETIRRDQCALTQKVLANALKTLFRHGVSAVKEYLTRQWRLIEAGKLPVSDFILTGRVRSKYRAALPVQAALARRLTEYDPGRVVRHKERLAYVIIASPGKAVRLSDAVMTPLELMEHWDLNTLNTSYYITKHVNAALQRCLSLEPHNIDVHEWYKSSPKPRRRIHYWPSTGKSTMISSFFGSDLCWFCGKKSKVAGRSHVSICSECRASEATSVEEATRRMNAMQKESQVLAQTCSKCNLCVENAGTFAALERAPGVGAGRSKGRVQTPIANCTCIDCPVLYHRHRAREEELELRAVFQALELD